MDEMSGKFKMRALTYCDAKITSTCTTAGQIKGQFKGRWMKCLGRFKTQALTHCGVKIMSTRTAVGQFKGQFNGAMDESSGKCSKMQAHRISGVVMDITAFKVSHSVGGDIDATALQAKKRSA